MNTSCIYDILINAKCLTICNKICSIAKNYKTFANLVDHKTAAKKIFGNILVTKIGVDTAENEHLKMLKWFYHFIIFIQLRS